MKRFTSFCLVGFMMLLLAVPQAKAIITDPDDYIIWDSGAFADSSMHSKFVLPDFMIWTPGIEFKTDLVVGRSMEEIYLEDFGFKPGTKLEDAKGQPMAALHVKQRKADDATANGERFILEYADYLKSRT